MTEKKYEFTGEVKMVGGAIVHRIRALRDIGEPVRIRKGDLGGWIEKEYNLSHEGDCWVYYNAVIFGEARVYGDAMISGNAEVSGYSIVGDRARVFGCADVRGHSRVYDNALIFGMSGVDGGEICGNDIIYNNKRGTEFGNLVG